MSRGSVSGRRHSKMRRGPCPRCGRDTAYSHEQLAPSGRNFREHKDPATGKPCRWWLGKRGL